MLRKEKILSLNDLKIGYISGGRRTELLPPLNASVKKGEFIAVIGRNGIGKSTLLRTLTGLQQQLSGDIKFEGRNIDDFSRTDLAQRIGYVSTEQVKVINMSVYELVALGRFPYTNWFGKTNSKDHEIIMDAIEKTSMSSLRYRNISELSDGERQKAMIARLLAQDTALMVMDEPTAFLDIGSKYEIMQILHKLSQNNNKTIIFSTHDLHLAIGRADKIWLILGNELREGAPEDLMLGGSFDNLFESSSVQFNSETGIFSIRDRRKGEIFIEGNGVVKHWTEEAVLRTGFSISKEKTVPYIKVIPGEINVWQIITGDSTEQFSSIYELAGRLSELD
jgi:iron complex transport system ATP-binding protein